MQKHLKKVLVPRENFITIYNKDYFKIVYKIGKNKIKNLSDNLLTEVACNSWKISQGNTIGYCVPFFNTNSIKIQLYQYFHNH